MAHPYDSEVDGSSSRGLGKLWRSKGVRSSALRLQTSHHLWSLLITSQAFVVHDRKHHRQQVFAAPPDAIEQVAVHSFCVNLLGFCQACQMPISPFRAQETRGQPGSLLTCSMLYPCFSLAMAMYLSTRGRKRQASGAERKEGGGLLPPPPPPPLS